jgi:hypothetical protein
MAGQWQSASSIRLYGGDNPHRLSPRWPRAAIIVPRSRNGVGVEHFGEASGRREAVRVGMRGRPTLLTQAALHPGTRAEIAAACRLHAASTHGVAESGCIVAVHQRERPIQSLANSSLGPLLIRVAASAAGARSARWVARHCSLFAAGMR